MSTEKNDDSPGGLAWDESIDLGRGLVTPGGRKITGKKLAEQYGLPLDMRGQTVVDLRVRDGLFAVACLQRGAAGVVCVGRTAEPPTLSFVRESLGYSSDQLRYKAHDVEEPMKFQADVVLCIDVVNRVERPMEVIRNAVKQARRMVIVECDFCYDDERIEWLQQRDDDSIWFPSQGAVLDALKVFGCAKVKVLGHGESSRATVIGTK